MGHFPKFPQYRDCTTKIVDALNLETTLAMWEMLFILIIGFMPPVLSLWVTYKTRERLLERVRMAQDVNPPWHGNREAAISTPAATSPLHYQSGIGYVIGDSSCAFNARSPHLRCAVNPSGPCTDCRFYEPIDGEQNNQQ